MKIDTLRRCLRRNERTKLYISTDEFLMAVYVYNAREEGEELLVDVGPYLVYSFARREILHSTRDFRGMRLGEQTRVTRRLNTYRRHVAGRSVPDEFLERAWEL